MKNKLFVLILVLTLCLGVVFTACDKDPTFAVTFDLNGGVGSVADISELKAGDTVTIPNTDITKEGFDFLGWEYGASVYNAGDTFVMPEENVTLVAKWQEKKGEPIVPDTPVTPTYEIIFDLNGGTGDAPSIENQEEGATVTIPEANLSKEYHIFGGWRYNDEIYNAGDSFTMPAEAVTLRAIWTQLDPAFSRESFTYDRLGAGPLELPLNLQGTNLYYVEINDSAVANIYVRYNEEKGCLVIAEEYILTVEEGEYTLKAITDGDQAAICTLIVDQSVKTSFDEQTTKDVNVFGDNGATFSVGFNGTTISSLKQGDNEVDSSYYVVESNSITIKSEFLKQFVDSVSFRLSLSNHDSYTFTVRNNVIFYTDYDATTIHDTTLSVTGQNSLYQYATEESIAIVDGPLSMSGKVFRFIPSEEGNTLEGGLYSVYTLKGDSSPYTTWYNVHYNANKYYAISFDYLTENTGDGGDFYIKSHSDNWKYDLLLGEDNDGVLHHFECVVSGESIGNGTSIYAKVLGGKLYFDNFSVIELSAPSITISSDSNVGEDYTIGFEPNGWSYNVLLDGKDIDVVVDNEAKTLTISASVLADLECGKHSISIVTSEITVNVEFNLVDNRVALLRDSSVNYSYEKHEEVKLYGSFDKTIEIVSIKQKEKIYDNGYTGGWSFAYNNTDKNYKDYASITAGLDNSGYITLSTELLDMLWGTTEFEITFDNGTTQSFNIVSTDVQVYTDYDNTTIKGLINGNVNNVVWASGFSGNAEIKDDGTGNNMLYITSSSGESCYYTIKINQHVWTWYNAYGDANHYYRVTFDYQIAGLGENSAWFEIFAPGNEDKETNVFGSYDDVLTVGDYYRVRFMLKADGEKHTFDSGYFTYNDTLRLVRIMMNVFDEGEGRYVAIDNFRLFSTEAENTSLQAPSSYYKGQEEDFSFSIDADVTSVEIDGNAVEYTVDGNNYTISESIINALALGSHKLVVHTSKACYSASFNLVDNRIAEISEASKNVSYGGGSVKVAGNFDGSLKITSITRKGSDTVWDPSFTVAPVALNINYVSVESDGLVVAEELINKLYGTTVINVAFDNGSNVEFTLISNVRYFSDYDEVNVFIDIPGNSVVCQDRAMISIVNVDGNNMLKYVPSDATLGHSLSALSNTRDNFCFTVDNRNNASYNWYDWYPTKGSKLIIFFDYQVVLGEQTDSYYQFEWQDINDEWHSTKLTGSGTFYIELDESEVAHFGINCPVSSKDLVDGTYLLIDAIGFGECEA